MMRRIILLPLLFVFTRAVFAETPEILFDEATQAYQQGKFTTAIKKYETLLSAGFSDGEIYYNIGNAHYKAGNISKAILNYERALRFMPNDDDLQHNLRLANLMITDRIEPAPRLFVWDWWDSIKGSFSVAGITWLNYVLYVLLIASLILMILSRSYSHRRMGFLSGLASGLCLTIALVVFAGKLNAVNDASEAIVTTDITTIKNSPDVKSSDAFVLHAGVKVYITDKVNDWAKIRLADGKVGWMENGAAEMVW